MELSIVIPTLNRQLSLSKTLQSIVDQQQVNERYQVIVVDNGSTDDTASVCRSFEKQIAGFIYYYDDEPGQLTGRHKGTELSTGNIISFIDDDVELNPNWINAVLRLFKNNESVSIIGGPCLPKYQSYPPSWTNYFWQPTPYGGKMCLPLSLIDIGCDELEIDPLYVFGLNYSLRKELLLKLGGFHPDCIPQHLQKYQGDGETGLSLRARGRNIKALYTASALLYHQVPVERLTKEYFENWYYYDGVCQSFTDIRVKNKLYVTGSDAATPINALAVLANRTGRALKRVVMKSAKRLPDSIVNLQTRFNNKYREGYEFHQHAFRTDKNVHEWVLRNDYWMYKLPG